MNDAVLAEILAGTAAQVQITPPRVPGDAPYRRQFLYNFIYSNNQMGDQSAAKLSELNSDLIEIKLNNVKINHSALYSIVDSFRLQASSPFMMKLALTNVNLSDETLFNSL